MIYRYVLKKRCENPSLFCCFYRFLLCISHIKCIHVLVHVSVMVCLRINVNFSGFFLDTQEAPKSLSVDSSSSLESLSSSHSGSTSTSNFSKGSTPPLSPRGSRKKSLFNPAEMEKMRMNKMQLMYQVSKTG